MTIEKGSYKVLQILNISSSLLSQIDSTVEQNNKIMKCLLEKSIGCFKVAYFIEPIDFGNESEIEILKEIKTPLILKEDFRVVKRMKYKEDKEFIKRMMNKVTKL